MLALAHSGGEGEQTEPNSVSRDGWGAGGAAAAGGGIIRLDLLIRANKI